MSATLNRFSGNIVATMSIDSRMHLSEQDISVDESSCSRNTPCDSIP
jgi:hypothetical protein